MDSQRLVLKPEYSIVFHSPDSVEFRYGVFNPESLSVEDGSRSGLVGPLIKALVAGQTVAEAATTAGATEDDAQAVWQQLTDLGVTQSEIDLPGHLLSRRFVPTLGTSSEAPRDALRVLIIGPQRVAELVSSSIGDIVTPDNIRVQDDSLLLHIVKALPGQRSDLVAEDLSPHTLTQLDVDLVVYLAESPKPVLAGALNRYCFSSRKSCLHAAIDGPFLLIGPFVRPNVTACYECFERRLLMNLRGTASYLAYKEALANGHFQPGRLQVPQAVEALFAAHAGLEVAAVAATGMGFYGDRVLSIYLPTMEISIHEILRVPECPICGSVPERDDPELHFDLRNLLTGE